MKLSAKRIVTAVLALTIFAKPAVPASAASCGNWLQVPSPNLGSSDNALAAVAAADTNDIWAVGEYAPDSNPNMTLTLTQHFDGTSWSVVGSPNVGVRANALFSVATASGRTWAAGYYIDSTTLEPRGLIESWDGTRWIVIDHPQPGTMNHLFGISAIAADDIWAVGDTMNSAGVFGSLVEHFDGAAWSVVTSANPGQTGNHLNGVVALAPDNAWAVGQTFGLTSPDPALIEHWDGTRWSSVASPGAGSASVLLYGITGDDSEQRGAGDAQSDRRNFQAAGAQGINGDWSTDRPLNVGRLENHFYGIGIGQNAQWAVGIYRDASSGNLFTLIERRDGSGWTVEPSASPGATFGDSQLGGVAGVGDADAWAVGAFDGSNGSLQSLVLHRCK